MEMLLCGVISKGFVDFLGDEYFLSKWNKLSFFEERGESEVYRLVV